MDDFLKTFVVPVLVNVIRTVLEYVQEKVQGTDKGNVGENDQVTLIQEPRSLYSTLIDIVALLQRYRRHIPVDTARRYSNKENMLQTPALHRNLTDQPWREPSVWDDKLEKSLMTEIKQLHSDSLKNVLIVGPIGAGKNSFIKSAINIFQRFKYSFSIYVTDNLITIARFHPPDYLHRDTVFCLLDETHIGEGIKIVDSKLFVNSSIEKRYLFNPAVGTIHKYTDSYRHRFITGCQIHCVIFVASATEVIADGPENMEIKLLRRKMRQTQIPVVLVLTMIDMICEEVGKDITKMYQSKKVLEVIKTASEMFEINKASIHPVVNYAKDSEMRTETNIPLLLALRQVVDPSSCYLQDDDGHHYLGNEQLLSSKVEKLLNENRLPKNDDLQSIYKDHGRKYEPLKVICEKICNIIKKKLYNDAVINVWPARNLANENVVFVVESAREAAVTPTFQHDLEILIDHGDSTGKKESIEIMTKERDFLRNKTDEYHYKLKKLQPILIKHSKQLMDKHKNITAILPCVIRSVGYGTPDKHVLHETLCISIHVKRKISGLIPLDEEPIPIVVEGIPTDVVKGEYRLFSNGSNDYHENLKMGLAIHARARNEKGDILGGTLGCFVQHKTYGMCCITNAHIVLQQSELKDLFKCGYMEYGTSNVKPVYQPLSFDREEFGTVVAAAGYNGNAFKPGFEVALIKILNRSPLSGSFPQSTSESAPTFTYNTGNVTDVNLLQLGVEVFKFGMETGPTFGFLRSNGASVCYNEGIQLHQQIEVIPATNKRFAASGDSGSSVFVGFNRTGRESVIGLISGGEVQGLSIFVTPIYEILQSVKCQPCLHRFENIDDNGTKVSTATHCAGAEESMDCNN